MRVLHAAAEIFPLVKTGGLADVTGALPAALQRAGADVRLVLPGLPAISDAVLHQKAIASLGAVFGAGRVVLRLGQLPYSHLPAYVVDAPWLYRRPGSPYQDSAGLEWPDNLLRFALLGWAAAHLAGGELDPAWSPDVLHAHDWHAGMACAYAAQQPVMAAASVFTIHNLAFQGLFPAGDFPLLGLPARFLSPAGLEYHAQLSFMKAGLKFADRVTTVSPGYAREIATPAFGCGLDGVIRSRGSDVSGILNGIDDETWDPARDTALASRYDLLALEGKVACKAALQREAGLDMDERALLFGVVSRLTEQKGLDLLLPTLPTLLAAGAQLVMQGSGDPALEAGFREAQRMHPGRISVRIGYDEAFAHRLIAGADAVLVPSRFEPCGLTQMYGLRYGTLPVVRRVGGLADTVTDATPQALDAGTATGFLFDEAQPAALASGLERAAAAWRQPAVWQQLMRAAMRRPLSWDVPAAQYLRLYEAAVLSHAAAPRRAPPA